jgi:hypothetical protein
VLRGLVGYPSEAVNVYANLSRFATPSLAESADFQRLLRDPCTQHLPVWLILDLVQPAVYLTITASSNFSCSFWIALNSLH